jgi:hypothetical protein
MQHNLDRHTVRCVATQEMAGLACGTEVADTGAPITMPVGDAVVGRLLDVAGSPIDHGPGLTGDMPRRAIHHPPPKLPSQQYEQKVANTSATQMRAECRISSAVEGWDRRCAYPASPSRADSAGKLGGLPKEANSVEFPPADALFWKRGLQAWPW